MQDSSQGEGGRAGPCQWKTWRTFFSWELHSREVWPRGSGARNTVKRYQADMDTQQQMGGGSLSTEAAVPQEIVSWPPQQPLAQQTPSHLLLAQQHPLPREQGTLPQ